MIRMTRYLALGALLFGAAANAGPITTGQWYTFGFDGPGSAWERTDLGGFTLGMNSIALDAPAWTITLASDSILTVVDGFAAGDTFEVLDFGAVIGMTGPAGSGSCGNDEIACLASGVHSVGTFLLAAGDHSLTGAVIDSPFGSGAAFFRIDPADVAEPQVLVLFGIGLIALGLSRRR